MDKFLMFFVVPFLFVLMIIAALGQADEKRELQKRRVDCFNKYELTTDYLKCVKPIEDREAQIAADEETAAVVAASTAVMAATVAIQ